SLVNKDDIAAKDLAIAAALSVHSKHPIAKALHGFTGDSPIGLSDISETAGEGLRAMMDGKSVSFGRDVKADDTDIGSVSWLKIGNRLPVKFSFEDTPRKNARESVAAVKALGIGVELLSGDKAIIAQRMGAELGFDHARGGMTPKDKQLVLSERTQAGHHTLMIGDGINDAPALASAYASASLATASDISRAAADIILQGDNLAALPYAIETARMAQKRVIENLSLAVIYNLCAIPLAVFGFVNPLIAALAMSGSSLIVMLNALRMIRK
ncbi:MAG: HAD-IC family P-type ATPase, partial [Robiginitomaculum sp.]